MARVGDTVMGMCPTSHGPVPAVGIISSGSPKALEAGVSFARVGDVVTFWCGSSVISTGSPNFLEAGVPVARMGDTVSGIAPGTISSGSPMYLET